MYTVSGVKLIASFSFFSWRHFRVKFNSKDSWTVKIGCLFQALPCITPIWADYRPILSRDVCALSLSLCCDSVYIRVWFDSQIHDLTELFIIIIILFSGLSVSVMLWLCIFWLFLNYDSTLMWSYFDLIWLKSKWIVILSNSD